jgi:regulator of sigma E protease
LGFGPKIVSVVRGGTEYCISLVPLGGYVKLAGENAEESQTPAPDEFMAKSKWVRFQVYVAGPVMNIALALLLSTVVLSQGADEPLYKSAPPIVGSITAKSPAEQAGLRVGDRIVSVNGIDVPTWDDVELAVLPKAGRELEIVAMRDGHEVSFTVTVAARGNFEAGDIGIRPPFRPQITQVNPGSPAEKGGVLRGDVLVALNGEPALLRDKTIERIRNSANTPLNLTVERGGVRRDLTVTPQGPPGAALIGVSISAYEVRRIDPTFGQAIRLSLEQNWEHTRLIGSTLRGLFTRDTPVRQLMGPVGIAQLSGTAAEVGWTALLGLMAMISLNLGLLNLMPVPVLDGGHIAILAVEGLARRDLSPRVKERILMTGASLVVLLMVTVIYNDIARLFR